MRFSIFTLDKFRIDLIFKYTKIDWYLYCCEKVHDNKKLSRGNSKLCRESSITIG